MGQLVDGRWNSGGIITSDDRGSFRRKESVFRNWISKDSESDLRPESQRYHLYVSYACPWAHRTLIMRQLKGLEDHVSVSVVHPDMLDQGWSFEKGIAGTTGDQLYGSSFLHEIYQKADPNVTTRVTVPVLWDKKTEKIVNNESSEIIRIFNSEFNQITNESEDYYSENLKDSIDYWNDKIYHNINNGVYRAGFAKSQEAYNEAVNGLFNTLDQVERQLEKSSFLTGDKISEADIRLFPTLVRFDLVYYFHFKCNLRRISDYMCINEYLMRLFEIPAFKDTVNFEHIKRHYYYSQESVNPYRVIPVGPEKFIF